MISRTATPYPIHNYYQKDGNRFEQVVAQVVCEMSPYCSPFVMQKPPEFINIKIQKDRLIDFRYNARYINLILSYNRRNISKGNDNWDTEEFTIAPDLQFDGLLFLAGYGRQSFNDIETLKSNEGLVFGLGKYFNWNAKMIGTAKKWNDYWQTEFQFIKGFEKLNYKFRPNPAH